MFLVPQNLLIDILGRGGDVGFSYFERILENFGFVSAAYIRSILSLCAISRLASHVFTDGCNDHVLQRERDAFPWHYWPRRKHRVRLAAAATAITTTPSSPHCQHIRPNIFRGRPEIKRRRRRWENTLRDEESWGTWCSRRVGIASRRGEQRLPFASKRTENARCNDCKSVVFELS